MEKHLEPPRATKKAHVRELHGTSVEDPWFWLRERDNQDVIAHLEAENEYTSAMVARWGDLPQRLFEEIRGRIQETDMSVPVRKGPWWYQARTVEGSQYPIHVRRPDVDGQPSGEEELLLDENTLAGKSPYLAVGDLAVSPDHSMLAYSVDLDGDEYYELRILDLATGEHLSDVIADVSYGVAWATDNSTIYYLLTDDTHRPHQVMRHHLGSGHEQDELIFEEPDPQFWVGMGTTRSESFIVISSESSTSSEAYLLDAADAAAKTRLVLGRMPGHEYRIEHHGDRLLIATNESAPDFRLVSAPIEDPAMSNWVDLIAAENGVRLVDVEAFADHLVVTRRSNNIPKLTVFDLTSDTSHDIIFDEEIFEAGGGSNVEYNSTTYRFGYTSMTSPSAVYDYDLNTRERTLLKRQAVLGDFDQDDYRTSREWAVAPDGTEVPVSVVWHRDTPRDGTAPGLLYGYGAYEIIMPATFSSARLSLLDRGFVFAIAHVRGGGELGRHWYDEARYEHKSNTFTDFIAVAEHLTGTGVIDPARLVIRGGSAGGLLVGAVSNMATDTFAGIVAEVPFVDNVNTMLDASLPLTVNEYEEWGNPADPMIYEAMCSYSPYENVTDGPYPPMYVTAGLNDPRVQFWEPAKWVSRLRQKSTSEAPILLKVEMGAGHGGPSGRYDAWQDEAEVLAFVLNCVGLS